MSTDQNKQYSVVESEETSFKDLVHMLRDFMTEAIKNWKIIFFLAILFIAGFLYSAFTTPGTYSTALTFMVNEDQGGGLSGVGNILNKFGLSKGSGEYNLDKISELATSRRIIRDVLFEKIKIDGQEDYIANQIITGQELHDKWEKDTTGLKGFVFKNNAFKNFSRTENAAFKSVYSEIIGNAEEGVESMLSVSYREETGIFSIKFKSTREDLSIQFVEFLYTKLSAYYIEETIKKPRQTYLSLKAKTDSIEQKLESTEYALANFIDFNRNLTSRSAELKQQRLIRQIKVLATAYGSALESLEIADFTLKTATPFFQLIDRPLPPLKKKRKSKLKAIVFGGFIGGFLAILFVVIRKIIRDALKEE